MRVNRNDSCGCMRRRRIWHAIKLLWSSYTVALLKCTAGWLLAVSIKGVV